MRRQPSRESSTSARDGGDPSRATANYHRSHALVLRLVPFSETSYVVRLLTREFGPVSLFARGARRRSNELWGELDLGATIEAIFLWPRPQPRDDEARQGARLASDDALGTLTESTVLDARLPLRTSPERYYLANALLEWAARALPFGHVDPAAHDRATAWLDSVTLENDPIAAFVSGAVAALSAEGVLTPLDTCGWCDARQATGTPVLVAYHRVDRVFLCAACAEKASRTPGAMEGHFVAVNGGDIALLKHLAFSGQGARAVGVTGGARARILVLVRSLLAGGFDFDLRTMRYAIDAVS
jgi:recombinational DNA repair protein (RecF pathway)